MCRFALYLGPTVALGTLLTDPVHSLAEQARESLLAREPVNGDGCGAAWYDPDGVATPMRFRDSHSAWGSDAWMRLGATRRSGCILAHVRAATAGTPLGLEECHPFVWETLAFMHNGNLPELDRFLPALRRTLSRRARGALRGGNDTAYIFALYTDLWLALQDREGADRTAEALRRTVARLEALRRRLRIAEPAYLNLAVADGRSAAACRHVSRGGEPAHSLFLRADTDALDRARAIVASEPLDAEAGWREVAAEHLVRLEAGGAVVLEGLAEAWDARAA